MDIGKVTKTVAQFLTAHPEYFRDFRRTGILPLGERVYVSVDKDSSSDFTNHILEALSGAGIKAVILTGAEKPISQEGEEYSVIMDALFTIHQLKCVDGVSSLPRVGTLVLVDGVPSEEDLGIMKENFNLVGVDGNFHRMIISNSEKLVDIWEINKEGKTVKDETPIKITEPVKANESIKPLRDTVIQKDEILDLKIALATSCDVNDFIKQLEGTP